MQYGRYVKAVALEYTATRLLATAETNRLVLLAINLALQPLSTDTLHL